MKIQNYSQNILFELLVVETRLVARLEEQSLKIKIEWLTKFIFRKSGRNIFEKNSFQN